MTLPQLTFIIPSRRQPRQAEFLLRSVSSIRAQSAAEFFEISIVVAVDAGQRLPHDLTESLGVTCVESKGSSQSAALNAAISQLSCDYVAILEDDDRLQPAYLEVVSRVLDSCDFVSSNQMEFDKHGNLLSFFDFPTPSGWFMPISTMRRVGGFNENFRFHIDNEWLGRLNRAGLKRIHLVEAKVPTDLEQFKRERPYLQLFLEATAFQGRLVRHQFWFPLVQRHLHEASGMAQIDRELDNKQRSEEEYELLRREFGKVPT